MSRTCEIPDPFRLVAPERPFRQRLLGAGLEKVLGLHCCRNIYRRIADVDEPAAFAQAALSSLMVEWQADGEGLEGIPERGPAIVVANHPFGGVEGLVLLAALHRRRPDVKLLANHLLGRMPGLRNALIPVNVFGNARANLGALRAALKWVGSGGLLVIFPAGEVSHLQLRRREVADPPWHENIGRLVRQCRAPVVPVYFPGGNDWLFQAAGLLHPRLRTALLARALLKCRGRRLGMQVGRAIAWQRLDKLNSDRELIDYLRLRTYLLAGADSSRGSMVANDDGRRMVETIEPQPCSLLAAEVARLPREQLLAESGALEVWQARADQIPFMLLEIGRLREVTFRAVGEGSGRACDLDSFDQHYLQLFLWHRERQEVVGGYRIGRSDVILPRFGVAGLYTSTLFNFRPRLFDSVGPALELGRSFVRGEYQKSYAPLLLLWKGIGRYVVNNPRYRVLFGPVSISRDYSDLSRRLIAGTLQYNPALPELARLVRAREPFVRKPVRIRGCSAALASTFCGNMNAVATLVADLETDQPGLPVLLRHYLNLGGKLLTFSLDRQFSDVVDGLILVDLAGTEVRTLERYLGKDGSQAFLTYQRLAAENWGELCA